MNGIFKKIILLLLLIALNAQAQELYKVKRVKGNLEAQIKSIFNSVKNQDNYWIGYSIERKDKYQVAVGTFFFDENSILNFGGLITGKFDYKKYNEPGFRKNAITISGRSINISHGTRISDNTEEKETAILIRYDRNSSAANDFAEIAICNFSHYADLQSYPVYWIGKTSTKESVETLMGMFNNTSNWYIKEELVPAIGVHTDQAMVITFLKNIFYGKTKDDLREDVIMWIGLQDNKQAFELLKKIIYEESEEFGVEAVNSMSLINSEDVLDELIKLAKAAKVRDIREHAIYALGNKAVAKAEKALKNFIEDDPDIEIKKNAIYALANTDNDYVPYLIDLAKNHSSLTIRKTAIYSLSNSEDERAISALIKLAQGN